MPKEFVLKYIDYMSMHKFNTFHFHLTEDQGWRIEIKKYPLLTQIGSVRKETLDSAVAYIMGAQQGNVWTEYMATPEHVEYMVYPRAAALAEVVWSPKESRDYVSFKNRMKEQIKRYDVYGINYFKTESSK